MINDILKKIRSFDKLDSAEVKGEGQFEINKVFEAVNDTFAGSAGYLQNIWRNADLGEGKYEVYHETKYFNGKRYDKSILIMVMPLGKFAYAPKDIIVFIILTINIQDYDETQKKGKFAIKLEAYIKAKEPEKPKIPVLASFVEKSQKDLYKAQLDQVKKKVVKVIFGNFLPTLLQKMGLNVSF